MTRLILSADSDSPVSRRASRRLLLALAALALAPGSSAADSFQLHVRSAVPARYYLDDSHGKSWTPANAIAYERRAEKHFVVPNGFDIALPPGTYSFAAERGPEYHPFRATIQAAAGASQTITINLSRWIDMNRLGWFSGDLHNHRSAGDMPVLLLADDLNLAPTLADWIWDDSPRSSAPPAREAIRRVDATHVYSVLDKEIERLKLGPGAVDLLGLRSPVPFHGYSLYPPNDTFARQAHAQGAWVDAEKIVWRDVAALVALGHVDFAGIVYNHFNRQDVELETGSWGMIPKQRPEFHTPAGMPLWAMDVYYRFLNCGFRLPVSAGSATGVKASPLGYNRVYVHTRPAFDYDGWFRSLKAGRSFATNGPMLFLSVSGHEPGSELRFQSSQRVRIQAESSSANPLDRLEIIHNGRIIHTVRGAGKLKASFSTPVSGTGWLAARAFEAPDRTVRFAHTSPVYIRFPGDPGLIREDLQFFLDWIDREIAFYQKAPGFREPAHREAMLAFFQSARQVYAGLQNEARR